MAKSDFYPTATAADANGIWITGASLARFDNAMQLVAIRSGGAGDGAATVAASMPDGGLLTLAEEIGQWGNYYCGVTRFSADGEQRWATAAASGCRLLGIDAGGGVWIDSGGWPLRLAADGERGPTSDVTSLQAAAVDPQSGVLYGIAPSSDPSSQGWGIISVDLNGARHLLWQASEGPTQISYSTVDPAGNLHALGTDSAGLVSLSLAPDGSVHFLTHPEAGNFVLVAFAAFADGSIASLDTTGKIHRIASDGTLQYSVPTIAGTGCTSAADCDFRLAAAANGDVIATVEDSQYQLHVMRLDDAGHTLASKSYANSSTQGLAVIADGSALIGPLSGSVDPDWLLRLDRTGNALGTPLLRQIVPSGASFFASAQAPDGTTYILSALVTPPSNSGAALLTKLSSDGQLLWKRAFPDLVSEYTTLQLNSDRLCLVSTAADGSTSQIECHSNDSGALLFKRALTPISLFTLLDDDEIVAYLPGQIANGPTPAVNATLALIDAAGNVAKSADLGRAFSTGPRQVAFSKNGSLFVSDIQFNGHVFGWDKNGNALYAAPNPVDGGVGIDGDIQADADGSVLTVPILGGGNEFRPYVWSLSPNGATRWLQARDLSAAPVIGKVADGEAFLFRTHIGEPPIMERYALADGTARPSVALYSDLPYESWYTPAFDAATGLLLFGDRYSARLISIVDAASGNLIRHVFGTCDPIPCDYQQNFSLALSTDGTLRVITGVTDPAMGATFRVDAYDHADHPGPAIRIDQAGIGGAWYPTYAPGQGFTLDYIADAQTIFMPWFTFSLTDAGVAGLNWFALQGSVTPSATSVDLVIARTGPGSFNTGAVSGGSVGTARLSFSDCAHGELHYKFDSATNLGYEGLIVLTRLTPSTAACVLADGSSVPAQNANPPAQGFDARQSGSWYDPATGGQGLEFTIIPPGVGSNGLVFAAWFTFDPVGHGDDAIHQHWFTLQGDLSTAADGKVVLPIYRIIDGGFESIATQNFSEVGHATLMMNGCDTAQLDYQFDTTEVAHSFAGLTGTSHLVKIGGCSAQ